MEPASFFFFFLSKGRGVGAPYTTVKAPPTRGLCLYSFGGCSSHHACLCRLTVCHTVTRFLPVELLEAHGARDAEVGAPGEEAPIDERPLDVPVEERLL